ncbi:hypothetical protein SEVIR_9G212200v4 [Setaria viridis]|uniref:DUF4408 domain-containing protein n=1 Tax=Setaria viridis TaxID=4556 RepID=A0A4U6SYM0_SETVI|nr:uncharacterized protein LOC117835340 [Setaria viridis]TKV93223.1 hypothetical protein SEVIR_9G212200v2 [Setaria viridis]
MDSSLLKATAVATGLAVLAATARAAAGSYIPTIDAADFFLWVAANAIVVVIWLLSSSSRRGRTDDDDDGSSSWAAAVDSSIYTSSSEYEAAFSDAGSSSARRAVEVPASRRRMPRDREARAAGRADRPRVRKKPAGHEVVPSARAVFAAAAREPHEDIRRNREETLAAFAATAAEPNRPGGDGADDDEDVSMDSLWESIVQRRAARPVVVRKSESWGNEELPRLKRVAETAATTARREMRKSVSAVSKASVPPPPPQPAAPSAVRQLGWRTRDVLVAITPDELLRRAESFIRRQHEHLRLQRQESEQRQLQLQRRLHAPALIRV